MRALVSIKLILLLVAAIHLDWHLARPHSMRLSLDWDLHWVTGIVVFAAVAWFVVRKWPGRIWEASAINISAGVVGAQILFPIGEGAYYLRQFTPLAEPLRWTIFSEFFAAGMLAYLAIVAAMLGRGAGHVTPAVDPQRDELSRDATLPNDAGS